MTYSGSNTASEVAPASGMTGIIKNFYDSVADGSGPYNQDVDKFSPSGPSDRIVEYARRSGAQRMLDLGSGMGTTLMRLAQECPAATKLYGVDVSDKMVARARARVAELTPDLQRKLKFFNIDAQSIPFMDGDFDLIFSECVLNLVPNRSKTMAEIARLLVPGGLFIYTDFVAYTAVPSALRENEGLVCGCRSGSVSLGENVTLMEHVGFTAIECFNFTEDQHKRYASLVESNPEIRRDVEVFQTQHPDMAAFLNNQMGYYLIVGVKA
jgi:ubiquinone/menaquinone biosynthesis C-methylase UbiE